MAVKREHSLAGSCNEGAVWQKTSVAHRYSWGDRQVLQDVVLHCRHIHSAHPVPAQRSGPHGKVVG